MSEHMRKKYERTHQTLPHGRGSDTYTIFLPSQTPVAVNNIPPTVLDNIYTTPLVTSKFSKREAASKENAEKVVKPPRNPTINKLCNTEE